MSKQTELHVDDLLNSFDSRNVTAKGAKDTKAAKPDNNDWDEQEEDNFALGIGKTQQATKAKAKKKTVAKGWGDIDAGSAPQQPTVQDFASIQDGEKKKKLFIKPNGQPKAPVNIDADAEYFPSLGEERPKNLPKKTEPTPVAQPVATSSSGVKKFVNVKKQGAGENFVPIEVVQERVPVVPEKTEPVVQQKPAGFAGFGFQRRTAEDQPKETKETKEVPVDTKFKFGGEGPKKFSAGGKISFKREEEKSEQELAREEKEKALEERLAREREELAKEREQREVRKAARGDEKNDSPKTKIEKTEKAEQVEKVEEKTEQPVEEKRIAKFSNSKKAEKAQAEPVVENKVPEVVAEVKVAGPVENVEMNGTLSNKGWGDGPLIKKAQKK